MTDTQPLRRSTRIAATADRAIVGTTTAKPNTKSAKVAKSSKKEVRFKAPGADKVSDKVSDKGVSSIALGDSLPNVTLKNQAGEDVNLSEMAASGTTIVLFSYPKASTPGCTRQACSFRDRYAEFSADVSAGGKVAVFGISADSPTAQTNFKTKQNLPYDLLCDPEFKLLGPLGCKKPPKSVVRSHFVVKDGRFVVVARGVKPDSSVGETLAGL